MHGCICMHMPYLIRMCMLCIDQDQEGRGGVRTVLRRTEVRLKDIKNVAESLYVN